MSYFVIFYFNHLFDTVVKHGEQQEACEACYK